MRGSYRSRTCRVSSEDSRERINSRRAGSIQRTRAGTRLPEIRRQLRGVGGIRAAAVRDRRRIASQGISLLVAAGLRVRRLDLLGDDHAASFCGRADRAGGIADDAAGGGDSVFHRSGGVGGGVRYGASRDLDGGDVADRMGGGGMDSHIFSDRLSLEPAGLHRVRESDADPVRGIYRRIWGLGVDRVVQRRDLRGLFPA